MRYGASDMGKRLNLVEKQNKIAATVQNAEVYSGAAVVHCC